MKIFLKVKFKTLVKSPKGPNCLLCPDVEGGGVQFSSSLDFGGPILKMHKMWGGGGSKYYDTGLAFYVKVVKLYYD